MPSSRFMQDLVDAQARALAREPNLDEHALADSEEVAEVLQRYKRPTPPYDPRAGADWARAILSEGQG